jgi:hypothetical protein
MTITVQEQPASRKGRASISTTTSIDYTWRLKGSDVIASLFSALAAVRPATVVDPQWGYTLIPGDVSWERIGFQLYDFTITYIDVAKADEIRQLDTGEARFSFSTMGGTVRVFHSLETANRYALPGKTAANHGKLIGVTPDGVEGADIVIPAMSFTIDYRHPKAVITHAFRRTLGLMTGTTNDATFMTHPAGEVLYMGAQGSQGTHSDPQLSHSFLHAENLTDQVIGAITGIAKAGHDYLWVVYEEDVDSGAKRKIKKPIEVHVEKLYKPSSFSALGIGTS